jgi:hypothetical protein
MHHVKHIFCLQCEIFKGITASTTPTEPTEEPPLTTTRATTTLETTLSTTGTPTTSYTPATQPTNHASKNLANYNYIKKDIATYYKRTLF